MSCCGPFVPCLFVCAVVVGSLCVGFSSHGHALDDQYNSYVYSEEKYQGFSKVHVGAASFINKLLINY